MRLSKKHILAVSILAFTVLCVCSSTYAAGVGASTDTAPRAWDIIKTLLISMIPIVELRGAIPIALASYKMSLPLAFITSYIGNCIIIAPVVLLTRTMFDLVKRWFPKLRSFFDKWEEKLRLKGEKAMKYETFGLLLFVAIPIPGTGAWTGSMIAGLLNMRVKSALPIIALGVLIAGVIVTIVTYGAGWIFGGV